MSFMDFGGLNVNKVKAIFKSRVDPLDALVGAIAAQTIGRAAGGMLRAQVAKMDAGAVRDNLTKYSDALGGVAVGVGLYAVQKGKGRATGHLVGAVGGALLPPVTGYISAKLHEVAPTYFGELQALPYGSYGELVAMGELKAMGNFADFSDFNGIEEEAVI